MHDQTTPSAWMIRHAGFVKAKTTLLDVASGRGRHSKFFASRGVLVTAVDRDAAALTSIRGTNGVTIEQRDLENNPWPYAPESFDCIVVCNYLWRPTAAALIATLKPGGLLLYETFMVGNERFGSPSRPDFLLRPNELLQWVSGSFKSIAFEQNQEMGLDGTPIAMKQKIAAFKLFPAPVPDAVEDDVGEATAESGGKESAAVG
ncbi:MAG: class I SAM-dependent methyltransferase [Casimicrobium sp.]